MEVLDAEYYSKDLATFLHHGEQHVLVSIIKSVLKLSFIPSRLNVL